MWKARRRGEVVTTANGVKIVGHLNVPGRVAASASLLYAKNLYTFLETMVDKEKKVLAVDMEDELVKATMLTHDGKVVHPNFVDTAKPAAKAAAPKKTPARKAPARKAAAKPAAGTAAKKPATRKTAAKPTVASSAADKPAATKSGGES